MNEQIDCQVYSAGATSGALYDAKFVELFNPTSNPIRLSNASIQYSSKISDTIAGTCALPDITIPANSYYMVSLTPDASFTENADFTCERALQTAIETGKVYLVPSQTKLSSSSPAKGDYIDDLFYECSNCKFNRINSLTEAKGYSTFLNFV